MLSSGLLQPRLWTLKSCFRFRLSVMTHFSGYACIWPAGGSIATLLAILEKEVLVIQFFLIFWIWIHKVTPSVALQDEAYAFYCQKCLLICLHVFMNLSESSFNSSVFMGIFGYFSSVCEVWWSPLCVIPKVLCWVEVRSLCEPIKFFHTRLCALVHRHVGTGKGHPQTRQLPNPHSSFGFPHREAWFIIPENICPLP